MADESKNQEAYEAGTAVIDLLAQMHRLRKAPNELVPFEWDVGSSWWALLEEIEEMEEEVKTDDAWTTGRTMPSSAFAEEMRDTLCTLLHMMITVKLDPVEQIKLATDKLRRRLDQVDAGMSWDDVKANER